MNQKKLLTGNEAIARGAWEAGVKVVAAYPGTPSTEITENAAKYDEIYSEWSPNEKVATEVALGAAIGGARSLVAMKHVGVNVAADPLFTATYTGVNGGFVLVSADDPGMHSSQNEQDNRYYGLAAKVPVLEPSDSQEAKDFTKLAFDLSEQFDTPVILRLTTRVAHSQSLVELKDRKELAIDEYSKNAAKFVMVPGNARKRRHDVEAHILGLEKWAETADINKIEWHDKKIGIITSGAVYEYVKEVLPEASVLKIGMTYPLPRKKIEDFAKEINDLYIIEELSPFIEKEVKSWGIKVKGHDTFPNQGEILPEVIAEKMLAQENKEQQASEDLTDVPTRPPVLCPGCPHRGIFYILKKLKLVISGDIGCYTLAFAPPLEAMDTTICMGASIGVAHGMEKARGKEFAEKTVAVLGDSTFLHSGITGLINTVYNKSNTTTIILDNSITAMTGHQQNPSTGYNVKGEPAPQVDLANLARACGVKRVTEIDPFDLKGLEKLLKEELAADEPSVIITKRPCILIKPEDVKPALYIDQDCCIACGMCMRIGCPAIGEKEDGKAFIDAAQCVGCDLCVGLCAKKCIKKPEQEGVSNE